MWSLFELNLNTDIVKALCWQHSRSTSCSTRVLRGHKDSMPWLLRSGQGKTRFKPLERFSHECGKLIDFALPRCAIGLKKSGHFIGQKLIRTHSQAFSCAWRQLRTCILWEAWLAHWIVCIFCDWLEWHLGFGLSALNLKLLYVNGW